MSSTLSEISTSSLCLLKAIFTVSASSTGLITGGDVINSGYVFPSLDTGTP